MSKAITGITVKKEAKPIYAVEDIEDIYNGNVPMEYYTCKNNEFIANKFKEYDNLIKNLKENIEMKEPAVIDVKIALIRQNAKVPSRQTNGAAGYDVYAALDESVEIKPGETKMIPLGFKTEFNPNYVAKIYARSGLSVKQGLAPANKVGIIDSDYRGEWMVALYNHSNEVRTVDPGMRIAQVVFQTYKQVDFNECSVEQLEDSTRGEGGFNSTGSK